MENEQKKPTFVHLHVHSHYSLLNALPKPAELAVAAKKDGQTAVAITDLGALYGAVDFYKSCAKEGIKAIIGLEAFVAPRGMKDKEAGIDKPRARVIFLAKNNNGYVNLIKMVTDSFCDGFYYKPRIDHELMEKYAKDLVCIIPSFSGEPVLSLKDYQAEKAGEQLDWYKRIYGDNLYLEITHHPEIAGHEDTQEQIIHLSSTSGVPLVASHDVYYIDKSDHIGREAMMKIQSGGILDTHGDGDGDHEDFSFITQAQAEIYFKDTPEALTNTVKIADECNVTMTPGEVWHFPKFVIESGKEPDDELRDIALKGYTWRGYSMDNAVALKRLNYELDVIKTKGYAKYFLVVGDLLREARERGILTTIRGSVAGSFTTYVLGITNVDPLEYELPFERFLNPERPSAPDIDMDFADNRRDEIIGYARDKYGHDHVAQIGTFGTMMARAAVRDVARALGHPYSVGDRIAKVIPMGSQGAKMTIKKALEIEPDFAKMYKEESEVREVVDLARKIEGRARQLGVHAAGVVIAPAPLNQFVPVQPDPRTGKLITQYEMHSVGEDGVGLLKFDFLGIKNLAILADAVKRVKKIRDITIDIEQIPVDDQKTFAMLARGETMGLFQLNGSGMTSFLKQLKPTSIHDINAMVALYRPGPMESIPQYIERKHNPTLITYIDPRLEKILDRSFGVITYQDDVMMSAIELAGYSWLDADKLRKAMGKKIPEVMEAEKGKLLKGFVEYGKMTQAKADELWKLIEPFAAYGFNKCLPANARVLNAETGVPTTITELLARKSGLKVQSLDTALKVTQKRASLPFKNGIKDVYKLTTRSGRVLRATDNHPLYAFDGWKRLDAFAVGERLAVPRNIPEPLKVKQLLSHEAATLGYLVSEGNLCHPSGSYFYSKSPDELQDFSKYAKQFSNTSLSINDSKSATSIYVGRKDVKQPNTLFDWIKKLGLHGHTATEKFVPKEVFQTDNATLALFLGKLWQGDGAVSVKNYQVFYATSSRQLADDVQLLLLRFGILGTLHTKSFKYRGERKVGYTVVASGHKNMLVFSKHIGKHLLSIKKSALKELLLQSAVRTNNRGRGTTDTVPAEVIILIKNAMQNAGITTKEIVSKTGLSERLFNADSRKRGYTRDILLRIGEALGDTKIIQHATSDIFWDEVVSIEKDSTEMTYDLSVPGTENFIANNFFVHNSHAASYGRVAYQTAYMKANFPSEYMSAVLTADAGDVERISDTINECVRMGIDVLPPDINESFADFSVVPDGSDTGGKIRFGLTTIKNFGEGISDTIIAERKQGGSFTSMSEFLKRIHDKGLNKKSLEALIMTGAFDKFETRGVLLENLDSMLAFHRENLGQIESSQDSLFSGVPTSFTDLVLVPAEDTSKAQKLIWEKELLGVYVSGHPLDEYSEEIEKRSKIADIKSAVYEHREIDIVRLKGLCVTAGMIEAVRPLLTKKGDRMAFILLSGVEDSIEMVAFPETYKTYTELFTPGTCVAIKGKLSIRNDEPSVIIDAVKKL